MPIMIQIQGADIVHQEIEAPLSDGTVGKRHILVLTDPISGLGIQTIFDEHEAELTPEGHLLLKKQADLKIAGPGDMPDQPPPGQGPKRPPMGGPGAQRR